MKGSTLAAPADGDPRTESLKELCCDIADAVFSENWHKVQHEVEDEIEKAQLKIDESCVVLHSWSDPAAHTSQDVLRRLNQNKAELEKAFKVIDDVYDVIRAARDSAQLIEDRLNDLKRLSSSKQILPAMSTLFRNFNLGEFSMGSQSRSQSIPPWTDIELFEPFKLSKSS